MRLFIVAATIVAGSIAAPALACAFDDIPGYNHYAVNGGDPYAGAYAEAAARIAEQRRLDAIENARLAMMKRLGLKDGVETASAGTAVAVANVQP